MQGVLAPVLTPFDSNLDPDPGVSLLAALPRAARREGCGALAPFGTTSEANSLSSWRSAKRLLAALLEGWDCRRRRLFPGPAARRSPTPSDSPGGRARGLRGRPDAPAVRLQEPERGGALPGATRRHRPAGEPRLRVYLYHIPQCPRCPSPLRVIERLLKYIPGRVVGIKKDSSGDFENTRARLRAFPDFEVFVGSEKFLLAIWTEGGAGCITATANVNARAISRAFRERKQERQREIDLVRSPTRSSP